MVSGASLSHLDTNAISIARANYRERLSNAANANAVEELDKMDDYQFLSKTKLIRNGEITIIRIFLRFHHRLCGGFMIIKEIQ